VPVLNNLGTQHLGGRKEYAAGSGALAGQVSANDVDPLSVHFPLCMKHLHGALKAVSWSALIWLIGFDGADDSLTRLLVHRKATSATTAACNSASSLKASASPSKKP